jgi:hypothetical protein
MTQKTMKKANVHNTAEARLNVSHVVRQRLAAVAVAERMLLSTAKNAAELIAQQPFSTRPLYNRLTFLHNTWA